VPPCNTCFLRPTRVHNPNGISIGSATAHGTLSSGMPEHSYLLKIAHSHRGIWTPSNAWFLEPTRAHNPNVISIGSAVRVSSDMLWNALPSKNAPSEGGSGPHLTCSSLGPADSASQTVSRSVQPFSTAHRRVSLYFTIGCHFPPQLPAFRWRIWNTI